MQQKSIHIDLKMMQVTILENSIVAMEMDIFLQHQRLQ